LHESKLKLKQKLGVTMKMWVKIFFFLTLGVISLQAYDKKLVLEAFMKLKQTSSYKNANGETIKVSKVSYNCKGIDCSLLVNGEAIDPNLVLGITSSPPAPNSPPVTPNFEQPSGTESGKMSGITEAHNKYRRELNIPDLVWDEQVAAYAQEWAENLKREGCNLKHRTRGKYGENLAWAGGKNLTTSEVVKMWYDEVQYYDYATNSCKKVCGHYTQVVWKNSKRLGCGMASCGNTEVWVCNYDPPGNFVGQKPY
jgi:uncharacterized protein YkwD